MDLIEKHLDRILFTILIFLSAVIFTAIVLSNGKWEKYIYDFSGKCESIGGVVYIPQVKRGWTEAECRIENSAININ